MVIYPQELSSKVILANGWGESKRGTAPIMKFTSPDVAAKEDKRNTSGAIPLVSVRKLIAC
jgi:hypothetical protein